MSTGGPAAKRADEHTTGGGVYLGGPDQIAILEDAVEALTADNELLNRRVTELERQLRLVLGGLDALRRASLMVIDPLSKALGLPKRN